jgi:MrfA Zn-binding domain
MAARSRTSRPPVFGELRPSQIITTFGPGSVVDLQNVSVVLSGTDFWATGPEQEIDEPRLRSMLRVNRFYRPPVRSDGGAAGVPSFLFPRYLRCPRCRRLGTYDRTDLFRLDRRRFRCTGQHDVKVPRGGPLVFPARFIVACSEGHLEDFPWFDYVHRGAGGSGCKPERLIFRESAQSAAVSDLVVSCELCDAWRPMEDAFGKRAARALGSCTGARPWLGDGHSESCTRGVLRTTLRGASNLYFSLVHSALSIPEWDDPVHAAIAHHEEQLGRVASVQQLRQGIAGGFLPRLEPFEAEQVFEALERRRAQEENRPTALDIRREEFGALRSVPDAARAAEREFQTEHVDVPEAFRELIDRVVIVRRLREVRALGGFTRIDSAFDLLSDEDEDQDRYRVQSLSVTELNWRPAVELRGEGIFLQLPEAAVRRWEERVAVDDRSAAMDVAHRTWRHERELPDAPYPGARFVLLHSLAHMLIQGLALDCGYSSTSIRERIYSSAPPHDPMAGILLYTATPDSDGSLGGLAEKGDPKRLEPLLRDALERALYCSSDPLCGHSAPGEMGHLNGAACHACILASETSCERGNRYLDRAHIVETVAQLRTSYFGSSIPASSSR